MSDASSSDALSPLLLHDRLRELPEPDPDAWLDYEAHGITAEDEGGLVELATDPTLLTVESDEPEQWVPVHAWRCLGQLGVEGAVGPLLDLLETYQDDEWLMLDVPEVFATIGPGVVEPVAAFGADQSRGLYPRMVAAEILGSVGARHPTVWASCVAGLTRMLEQFEHEESELNALVIGRLVSLEATEAAPVMRAAFEAGRVDLMHMGDWEDVQIELGLLSERQTPRPPNVPSWDPDDADGAEPVPLPDSGSLSPAGVDALERVLARPEASDGVGSVRGLEGFLFAIACVPGIVQPSQWLPVALGEEGMEAADPDEVREALAQILTLYGTIQEAVNEPELAPPEGLFRDDVLANLEEDADASRWCRGFARGHWWAEDTWEVDDDDRELNALLLTLSFFASRKMAERYTQAFEGGEWSLEEVAAAVRTMWPAALGEYASMGRTRLQERMAAMQAARSEPARATAEERTGRNDPCPCGSGRKFKRCCGAGGKG